MNGEKKKLNYIFLIKFQIKLSSLISVTTTKRRTKTVDRGLT